MVYVNFGEKTLPNLGSVGAVNACFQTNFLGAEYDNFLQAGASQAAPQTPAEERHFQAGKGQDQPVAEEHKSEGDAKREHHHKGKEVL